MVRVLADVAGRGRRARRAQRRSRGRSSSSRGGTAPQFTPDGKFVIFTIVPPKSETDANQPGGRRRPVADAAAGGQRRVRREAGARTATRSASCRCPSGQVTTVEQISPASGCRLNRRHGWRCRKAARAARPVDAVGTWRRRRSRRSAGCRCRWSRRRRSRRAAQAATPPAGSRPRQAAGAPAPRARRRRRRRRKEPGNDLIVRNLTTGQDVTIPEVTEFVWDKNGHVAASTPCRRPMRAKDGAFARQMSDGTVHDAAQRQAATTRVFAFDEDGTQVAFLSDAGGVRQAGRRRTASITGSRRTPTATELVSARDARHAAGHGGRGFRAALHRRRQRAAARRPAPPPPSRRRAGSERAEEARADPGGSVELQGSADPADAEGPRCSRIRIATTARSCTCRTSASCSSRRPTCRTSIPGADPNRAIGTDRICRIARKISWDADLQRRVPRRSEDRRASQGARPRRRRRDDVARRASTCCSSTRRS